MYLFSIELSGFRGIHSLELRLGATTVLIGENDWGKASLFEMLERCLGHSDDGMPSFSSEDMHRDPEGKTGPIQVILSFREDAKGEFDKPEFAQPGHHLAHPRAGLQIQQSHHCGPVKPRSEIVELADGPKASYRIDQSRASEPDPNQPGDGHYVV